MVDSVDGFSGVIVTSSFPMIFDEKLFVIYFISVVSSERRTSSYPIFFNYSFFFHQMIQFFFFFKYLIRFIRYLIRPSKHSWGVISIYGVSEVRVSLTS